MKKKHLTVICGVFLPEPSPTGLCAKRFIELLDEKYDIDVICISPDGTNKIVKDESGHTVYMLTGYRQGKEDQSIGLERSIWHQLGRIEIKSFLLGNLNWYSKAVYKCLKFIHGQNRINTVFSICSPFAAHIGAYEFKIENSDVKWCAYTVDPYSTTNRIRPFWCTMKGLIKYEQRILRNVDHLLLSDEVYNSRPELIKGKNTDTLPYILPENNYGTSRLSYFKSEDINCVYAGRLYEDIRNPEPMLEAFSRLSNTGIKLHLFSVGCEEIVRRYASATNSIILHKQVPHEQIREVYTQSDILVSLANDSKEFLPSKTFEYIASCKPIVEFLGGNNALLESYPLAFLARKGQYTPEELRSFCLSVKGKTVDPQCIRKIYARHTANRVREQLLYCLG